MEDIKNTSIEFYNSERRELITSTTKIRIHSFLQYGDVGLDIDVDLKNIPENLRGLVVQILWKSRMCMVEPKPHRGDNEVEVSCNEIGYLGKFFKWVGKVLGYKFK